MSESTNCCTPLDAMADHGLSVIELWKDPAGKPGWYILYDTSSNARCEARELGIQVIYQGWQKAYQELKEQRHGYKAQVKIGYCPFCGTKLNKDAT